MSAQGRLSAVPAGVTVVTMPAEIRSSTSEDVSQDLVSAIFAHPPIIVVDFTQTTFCDTAVDLQMVLAHRLASADGINLRLVVPPGLSQIFAPAGPDRLLPVYPTLSAALTPKPLANQRARRMIFADTTSAASGSRPARGWSSRRGLRNLRWVRPKWRRRKWSG